MNTSAQRWKRTLSFLKSNFTVVALWPIACTILIALLWNFSSSKIQAERKQLEANTIKSTSSLASSYAQYLTRTIEQIDQVSKHIKYDWEKSNGKLRLEKLKSEGIFTGSQFTYIAIIGVDGKVKTSTKNRNEWFDSDLKNLLVFHRNNISSALKITLPNVSNQSEQQFKFTRRLDKADDSFDGMIVFLVDPNYFVSFYEKQSLGNQGILAIIDENQKMSVARNSERLFSNQEIKGVDQTFEGNGDGYFSNKNGLIDEKSRYVAWHELSSYPLTALAALSEDEIFAVHLNEWSNATIYAFFGSFLLLLIAVIATILSIQLAWKKFEANEVNHTYRIATEGTKDGFYMLNARHDIHGNIMDFKYVDCNVRGAHFLGLNREELIGVNLSSLHSETDFEQLLKIYCRAMETGLYEDEFELRNDGSTAIIYAQRRLVRSGTGLALTIRDISSKIESKQELERLANHDSLTGLHNRHWLLGFLPQAIKRAKDNGYMIALLFIDLDGFKNVNDTKGHAAGDQLLKSVSSRLQSVLRPSDNVIRLGGDEFIVALEPIESDEKPAKLAERIAEAFRQVFWLGDEKHQIGASIGISVYPRDGEDSEALLKNADIAMYAVKAAGKGHYTFFKPELYTKLKERFEMEQALIQALELNQFTLHYQPRVNAITGEMTSMEALIRWNHPEKGWISPADFIPVAESTGLILPLGDLVMDRACAQLAQWNAAELPPIPVSINVSARQFHSGDLGRKLAESLQKYGVPKNRLEVEITESAMMGEDNDIIAELTAIRSMGIELLVDDFGTGYSSLSQLQRLDMDVLKVDRVFTNELGLSREGEIFFKAIVSMAHALDMKVVAEGVETQVQLDVLRLLQCDEIQGYFISRPLPPEKIPHLMRQRILLMDNFDLFQSSFESFS